MLNQKGQPYLGKVKGHLSTFYFYLSTREALRHAGGADTPKNRASVVVRVKRALERKGVNSFPESRRAE